MFYFWTMRIELQYLNDIQGNTQAVQLSINEWKKVLSKLKKYEQAFKLKSDLTEAFKEVGVLKQNKKRKQTLAEFLDGL
jgi:hypothetical protein